MSHRRFSLDEANAMIPRLEQILSRLLSKKETHEKLHDELFMEELLLDALKNHAEDKNQSTSEEIQENAREVDGRVFDLETDLRELRALGAVLRSLERAWVEIPGERGGEQIFWCWKKGESQIMYYRAAGAAAALERHPIS